MERLNTSGGVKSRHAYTAYGREWTSQNPNDNEVAADPWGFGAQSGYFTDKETGYLYCTFRYYDPAVGRWLNRDPIGYGGGLNLYKYCSNNPVMGIDPLGLADDGDWALDSSKNYGSWGSLRVNYRLWSSSS